MQVEIIKIFKKILPNLLVCDRPSLPATNFIIEMNKKYFGGKQAVDIIFSKNQIVLYINKTPVWKENYNAN